jgi:hypothetical protein
LQNKANLPEAQIDVSSFITKEYRKIDAFAAQKNKANSKPISKQKTENRSLSAIGVAGQTTDDSKIRFNKGLWK